MKYCEKCNKYYSEDKRYCSECGCILINKDTEAYRRVTEEVLKDAI